MYVAQGSTWPICRFCQCDLRVLNVAAFVVQFQIHVQPGIATAEGIKHIPNMQLTMKLADSQPTKDCVACLAVAAHHAHVDVVCNGSAALHEVLDGSQIRRAPDARTAAEHTENIFLVAPLTILFLQSEDRDEHAARELVHQVALSLALARDWA